MSGAGCGCARARDGSASARDGGRAPGRSSLGGAHELGLRGQALAQREADSAVMRREVVEVRPRPLGVDVVGGERRDATPVVDAGAHEQVELRGIGEVRRRLDPHGGSETRRGDGDGGEVLAGRRHPARPASRCRFARKFWTMTSWTWPSRLRVAEREQRLGAVAERLADADQDAGGERDRQAPGVGDDRRRTAGSLSGEP